MRHYSADKIKDQIGAARMGERERSIQYCVGKPKENRPRGRPRHRRDDNIKMNFRETGRGRKVVENKTN